MAGLATFLSVVVSFGRIFVVVVGHFVAVVVSLPPANERSSGRITHVVHVDHPTGVGPLVFVFEGFSEDVARHCSSVFLY